MDNLLVFDEVMQYFDLNEILSFREVCSTWKYNVENYLEYETSLTIFNGNRIARYPYRHASYKLNYNFSKSLVYRIPSNPRDLKIEDFLVKLMPNIKELCLLYDDDEDGQLDMEFLLSKWKNINKLMVTIPKYAVKIRKFLKHFNALESLETFIIVNFPYTRDNFRFKYEPFLGRIKHIYVPVFEWLLNIVDSLNLKTLGVGKLPVHYPEVLFQKIENFYNLHCDETNSSLQPRNYMNFLQELLAVCKNNLRSLRILHDFKMFKVCFSSKLQKFLIIFF